MIESLIATAIQEQRLVRLQYEGRSRTVAPHQLGLTDANTEALLCWQADAISPGNPKWQLLDVRKIYGLLVLDQKFGQLPESCQPPENMLLHTSAHQDS